MKKILLLAALVTGTALSAQDPVVANKSSYSVTVDFPYAQTYVFRGLKLADNSLQPSIKYSSDLFYVGVWSNAPLDRGYELELDYSAGHNFALSKNWSLDAGATLYTYPGLDTPGADRTTFEPYLGLNGSIGVVSSGSYVYYDCTLKAFTAQQTFGYTIASDSRTTFSLLGTIGHVAPDVGPTYTYGGVGLTVSFKLFDKATLNLGGQYATHDMHSIDDTHFWGTAGLTYTF